MENGDHSRGANGGLAIQFVNTVLNVFRRTFKRPFQVFIEAGEYSGDFRMQVPLYGVLIKAEHVGVDVCKLYPQTLCLDDKNQVGACSNLL